VSAARRRPAVLRACLALAALAGCALSQPTRFYTLSTVTAPAKAPVAARGLVIGFGPLTLPPYLDRPDIVTRVGANEMRLGDFSQWAEPLEPLLTRIMAEDLYALLGAEDVIPIPQRGDLPLDRVVEVHLTRFDADEAGEVTLDARWRVYQGDHEALIASGRSQVVEQGAAVPDYDAIVAAMSRAVGRLSAEIAAAIVAKPPAPARKVSRNAGTGTPGWASAEGAGSSSRGTTPNGGGPAIKMVP
jgi:uncharacterized protein